MHLRFKVFAVPLLGPGAICYHKYMPNATRQTPDKLPLESIAGVGPRLAKVLLEMKIETVGDLLAHYPLRYLDLGTVKEIARVREGDEVTVVGLVKEAQLRRGYRGRMTILTVGVFDGTGYVEAVWFNQAYVADKLPIGTKVALSGRVTRKYGRLQLAAPFYDVIEEEQTGQGLNTGRIIPVHPATAKLSAARIRRLIKKALEQHLPLVEDNLPVEIVRRYGLVSGRQAVAEVHFPSSRDALQAARKRLVFEEFFWLELGLALRKQWLSGSAKGIAHQISGNLLNRFYKDLPWRLTPDQQRALKDIRSDMESERPMHRLLYGEVGSGKTVVAAAAAIMAIEGGRQAALMAPTEVLAEQHYLKLREPLENLGLKVFLALGRAKDAERRALKSLLAEGTADIVIGTHALIQDKVRFDRLGLVIIDEQHRFGVRQRLGLRSKGDNPDMLVLTATPIPRTLALTLYGDLDISTLMERPGGRSLEGHVKTRFLTEQQREQAYRLIKKEAAAGRRAYVICPLVDESDKLAVKSVLKEADRLANEVFVDLRVGLLHGRLPSEQKEMVMSAFRGGDIDILIATTVIEVGVDVPEATVILIEHAERFGLSQLHQLRGRVGRGQWPSICLLLGDLATPEARARIDAILTTADGFKLAEADLNIRGEGQLFGLRQSGLPDLKLAKLTKHIKALEAARREAFAVVAADQTLTTPQNRILKAELKRRFAGSFEWLMSG